MQQLTLGDIIVDVEIKDIKNLHLSVLPPIGKVRIAAPIRMNMDTIRIYALSKLSWIKQQQTKFNKAVRESNKDYIYKEGHFFLGKRYLLHIHEAEQKPYINLKHNTLHLTVRPGASTEKKEQTINEWYRQELRTLAIPIISKYESIMNVKVNDFGIKSMKTKWGTCNTDVGRIWINLELAKKPLQCIEYIIVHEMVHLLERSHNKRFQSLMNQFLPDWKHHKNILNQLPVSHRDWQY